MMLAGFFFVLLVTGNVEQFGMKSADGSTFNDSEHPKFQQKDNQDYVKAVDGKSYDGSYDGSYNGTYNGTFDGSYNGSHNGSYDGSYNGSNNGSFDGSYNGYYDEYFDWYEYSYHDVDLLFETNISISEYNCTSRDVFKKLNLTYNIDNSMIRPHRGGLPTIVVLDVLLYAILDVNEKDQQFVSYIWIDMWWNDTDISWNPKEYCGINKIHPPKDLLWMPDIAIEEMTEKDKAPSSPYLDLRRWGKVILRKDMMVVSTCQMEIYRFPFDSQSCKLSFKSVMHSNQEIEFIRYANSSRNADWSRKKMGQSEWMFIDMTIRETTINNFSINQSMLVYTITMKRRSALYFANFLLPILFFLFLDLTSFMISDTGGEKLGFKVTVLLAVTVMQLILNDILPASSDRIPLISVYCIGIFGLMMLSLLETMLVMYLLKKDSASQDNGADKDQTLSEDCEDKVGKANCCTELKKWTPCPCVCNVSVDETPSEQLSVAKEGNSGQPAEEPDALEKVSDELKEVEKTLTLLNSRKEEGKPGYWTRVAKIINTVFFIFYVMAASVFLTVLFLLWSKPDDK